MIQQKYFNNVADMSLYDLEETERAIAARRNQLYAEKLHRAGFRDVTWRYNEGDDFDADYIAVGDPGFISNQYAPWEEPEYLHLNIAEAQQMLDTVVNVPLAETFKRMRGKVSDKFPLW